MDRLQSLKVFTRVVELKSFSRAANDLEMSNATVSSCIKQLEGRLGVTLVSRSTRQLRVTQEGNATYERAIQILHEVEEMEEELSTPGDEVRGTLRIDLPPTTALQILIPALPAFRRRYPGIRLEVSINPRFVDLIQLGIDCAIRIGTLADSSLVSRQLGVTRIMTAASPAYLAERGEPATPDE